jgi:diphthamide synthase (EF-2-diphthine--ammonia ligase)
MAASRTSDEDTPAQPPLLRVWLSWSSGKDCAWALHTLRSTPGVAVVGLLTTLNEAADRVAMHAVRATLLVCCERARGAFCGAVKLKEGVGLGSGV